MTTIAKQEAKGATARKSKKPLVVHTVRKGEFVTLCGEQVTQEEIRHARRPAIDEQICRCNICSVALYLQAFDMYAPNEATAVRFVEACWRKEETRVGRSFQGGEQ